MTGIVNLSCRDFLKTGGVIGRGLILGFSGLVRHSFAESCGGSASSSVLNAFVRIAPDDTVTIVLNHSEMGQGVYTALPMLVAEELECDWTKVKVESAQIDPAYDHTDFGMQMTGGSTSVSSEWERLRQVGASAREMLISAAAATWKVDKASCRAEKGTVIHATGKRLPYGQLAAKAAHLPVPKVVRLKSPSEFTMIGTPVKRLDTPIKTNGTAVFGIDVKVPGMLTAVVARSPVVGRKGAELQGRQGQSRSWSQGRRAGAGRRCCSGHRLLAGQGWARLIGDFMG